MLFAINKVTATTGPAIGGTTRGSKLPPRVPTLIEESKDRIVGEENVLASSEPRAVPQIINAAPTCLDSIAINEK